MISHNVQLFYRIPPHCVIQSRDIYTRIYTHLCMHTEFAPFPEREIGALSYPFPGSHARCSSQFHFDPSLRANSTRCYARVVSARENLVARRATDLARVRPCDRVSRNFYWTIRAVRFAPLPTKIMRWHEPLVSGKSIEHTDRKRSDSDFLIIILNQTWDTIYTKSI